MSNILSGKVLEELLHEEYYIKSLFNENMISSVRNIKSINSFMCPKGTSNLVDCPVKQSNWYFHVT